MESAGLVIGVAGIALFVAGVVLQVLTFRRRRPVRPGAIAVGQVASLLAMVAFSLLTLRPPGIVAWILLLGFGGLAGTLVARLVKVERTQAGVVMSYTLPWLLVWAALVGLTQLFALFRGTVPVLVYGLAIANAGLNAGMNAAVVARSRKVPGEMGIAAVLLLAALAAGSLAIPQPVAYAEDVVAKWRAHYYTTVEDIPGALQPAYAPQGEAALADDTVPTDAGDVKVASVAMLGFGPETWTPTDAYLSYAYDGDTSGGLEAKRYVHITYAKDRARLKANAAPSGLGSMGGEVLTSIGGVAVDAGYYSVQAATGGSVHEYRMLAGDVFVILRASTGGSSVGSGGDARIPESEAARVLEAATSVDIDEVLALVPGKPGAQNGTAQSQQAPQAKPGGGTKTPAVRPAAPPAPLSPARAGGAVLLSGLAFASGSLVQLLVSLRRGGAPILKPLTPEERRTKEMLAKGMVWSDRWGWVTPDELRSRESSNEDAAARNRQQDREAAKYASAAADARRELTAIQARRENLAKVGQLLARQRELERIAAEDAADAAYWERLGRAADYVQTAADLGVSGIASFTGPAGQVIRAGYDVAKGVAGGLGTAIATDGDIGTEMARGYVRGLASAAIDTATDLLGRKLLGGTPAAPGPTPPDLLRTKAVVQQTLAGVDEAVATKGVRAAADGVDPAKVLALYRNGGMAELGRLEAAGAISPAQAKVLNEVLGRQVDGSIHAGVNDAISEFQRSGLGVRLKEVLVGDSGSSAVAGKARSVLTDFDRTAVASFEHADVVAYAQRNGMDTAHAYDELNRVYARMQERAVGARLGARGVSAADVDYKTYSGFGSAAGQADSYPAGFALTRQSVQGRTTVFTAEGASHGTAGDAVLDQWRLEKAAAGQPAALGIEAKITSAELPGIAEKQLESLVAHADAKSAAKAIDRMQYCANRLGTRMDARVSAMAAEIKADPQGVARVLRRHGMTEAEFVAEARKDAARVAARLTGN